jgi:hypothetical protein
MKLTKLIIVIVAALIAFSSCKKLVHRDVNCRGFSFTDEYYWFPQQLGDTISFVNGANVTKKFVVADKYINHRKQYVSDTGCGCNDVSSLLLTSENDSLWFRSELKYIEDQPGNRYEDVVFVLNGVQSTFYETHRNNEAQHVLDTLTFMDVRRYDQPYTEVAKVKQVFTARNLGIISFELVSGELWVNSHLNSFNVIEQSSFDYSENVCE